MKILLILFLFLAVSECCDRTLTLNSGQSTRISSPNFPRPYPRGTRCTINVNTATASNFSVRCRISTPRILCRRWFRISSPGIGSFFACGRRLVRLRALVNVRSFTVRFIGLRPFFFRRRFRGFSCKIRNIGGTTTSTTVSINSTTSATPTTTNITPTKCPCQQTFERIINGSDADIGEYPHIVQLTNATGFFFCGGSIVSSTKIITAAHCVDGSATTNVRVVAGAHTIRDSSNAIQMRDVSTIQLHPDWDSSASIANDIAVVMVSSPFNFTSRVRPICLPNNIFTPNSSNIVNVAGWGLQTVPGPASTILQEAVNLPTTPCSTIFRNAVPSQFCAINSQTVCFGDSGGPVMSNGNTILQGVVSFTTGQQCQGMISGFSSVSQFLIPSNSFLRGALGSELCIPTS